MKQEIKRFIQRTDFLRQPLMSWYEASGHKPWSLGYSFYKYDFIRSVIENKLDIFRQGKLPAGYGFRLDDRIVEYPWFFSQLKNEERVILDAGSSLNHDEILRAKPLDDKKLYIMTLQRERAEDRQRVFSYVYGDLRSIPCEDSFFDAVVSISTVEHIGMDNTFLYTADKSKKENDRFAYLAAIQEFRRVLKNSGSLYITVPYGKHKNHGWFQVFDDTMVDELVRVFAPAEIRTDYFRYSDDQWNYADKESCRNAGYFDIHVQPWVPGMPAASEAVICMEMKK